MKVLILSGSRADLGILHFPVSLMQTDPFFDVTFASIICEDFPGAFRAAAELYESRKPDLLFILGDRWEIMAAATAAHLQRIPIAHLGGGDVSEGSYDDAMRDCISRMAAIHFVTSSSSLARLIHYGLKCVHLVGNPAVDYIQQAAWQRPRAIAEPYVLVSYQAETIDGKDDMDWWINIPADKTQIYMRPNPDLGSDEINGIIESRLYGNNRAYDYVSHDEFLNLLYHCDEFIGNSSAIFYEAPFLKPGGVPCRLIGKRQRGRVIPWGGEGRASERIVDALKRWTP